MVDHTKGHTPDRKEEHHRPSDLRSDGLNSKAYDKAKNVHTQDYSKWRRYKFKIKLEKTQNQNSSSL